jgi:hypothetical protein
MNRIINSLKEAALGRETNIPICTISGKKTITVFYTYYEGNPRSHRLEFCKGSRTVFEIFLPRHDEDIACLSAVLGHQRDFRDPEKTIFGFWLRWLLFAAGGKLVRGMELFAGPASSHDTSIGRVDTGYRYRVAHLRRGKTESIVIVSSRKGNMSGPYRKAQSTEFNWLKLPLSDFEELVKPLDLFLVGNAYKKEVH